MADPAPGTPEPLQFLDGEADGLCDPSTGVCTVPGAPAPGTDPSGSTGPTARSDGDTAGTLTGC
ncbi:hypothetical protein [Streptomyces olivochromogenes]|uniref:Uncharacterized protein n=1 Tax=Streptomyces olivochromogenes TaxID=1963 RepID=A0A286PGX0_STROL|nr:hypothetical protein [Streptomyces olivochromogenes]KUN33393.1 hypothetical protein AQJ27_50600 [Streptomyces olivochromogenes]GAX58799.1 hypothetical protein SO3561_10374 [Streptomyces olivochromogenes]